MDKQYDVTKIINVKDRTYKIYMTGRWPSNIYGKHYQVLVNLLTVNHFIDDYMNSIYVTHYAVLKNYNKNTVDVEYIKEVNGIVEEERHPF